MFVADLTKYETIEDLCPICRVMIFGLDMKTGAKGPMPNQCQFKVKLSSGTWTDIGMCKDCFKKVTDAEIEQILEGIKKYWASKGFIKPVEDNWKIVEIDRTTVW